MKISFQGSNVAEVETKGRTVLFSYGVPVAVFVDGEGAFRTAEGYSATTSKHINAALRRWGASKAQEIPQTEIEAKAEGKARRALDKLAE